MPSQPDSEPATESGSQSEPNEEKIENILDLLEAEDFEPRKTVIYMKIPTDGGWAWFVLVVAFLEIAIVDGIISNVVYLFPLLEAYLNVNVAKSTVISSLQNGLYYCSGPFSSALVNKLGFRNVTISSSVAACVGILICVFTDNYPITVLCYGVILGIAFGTVSTASQVIVNYYFEKYRALASGICSAGTGFGILALSPITKICVDKGGLVTTFCVQAALCLTMAILAIAFKPLPTQKIALMESIGNLAASETIEATPIVSKSIETVVGENEPAIEAEDSHTTVLLKTGPLDRKDIYYEGNLTGTPEYDEVHEEVRESRRFVILPQTSASSTGQQANKPVNFALKMTRAEPVLASAEESKWISCAWRIKSVLKVHLNWAILKSQKFQLLLLAVFFYNLGNNVPFLFIMKRSTFPDNFEMFLIPIIGILSTLFRTVAGWISFKFSSVNPSLLIGSSVLFAGCISLISSEYGQNIIWMQMLYCTAYSIGSAFFGGLRTTIIVQIFGLSNLTNCFGIVLLVMGISMFLGLTLCGLLVDSLHNADSAFKFAGFCYIISASFYFIISNK